MKEIIYTKSYREYKAELENQLTRSAEGFVRIGYLLKIARDTDILSESPYENVVDFAKAEYGIDKTQVSRFIHINDKFSEGGYSDRLMERYRGFGWAKLTLMLRLPDTLNEELTPNFSKAEIQTIKEEIDEENKVTDIERILEGEPEGAQTLLDKAITQLGENETELYGAVFHAADKLKEHPELLREIMVPSEEKIYSIRIRGTGRVMMSLSDSSDVVKLINSRTGEKTRHTWEEMAKSWIRICDLSRTAKESWESVYERSYPEKEEIAPVQQEKQKPRKQSKVVKAKPAVQKAGKPETPKAEESVKKEPEEKELETATKERGTQEILEKEEIQETEKEDLPVENTEQQEEQIPGQQDIMDYPEVIPENMEIEKKEYAIEDKLQTRKEYLDGCTEYGAALYLHKWFMNAPDAKEIISDTDRMEEWLKGKVDLNGRDD